MALVVASNMAALNTYNTLKKNNKKMNSNLEKAASGMKINSAKDDASGYAISERMRVRIRALSQADNNTHTGISLIRTAEGAIQSQIEILKTIKAKVIDAQNDTNTDIDRGIIQKEIDQGYQQMEDIAYETNYNGILLLCGGDLKEYNHTNWSEEKLPEFGVHDNVSTDFGLINKTVTEDKSVGNRQFTGLNQQPLSPHTEVLDKVNSVYDIADPYYDGIAKLNPTTGSVGNSLQMTGGVNWRAATNSISIDYSGKTADDVLNSLKNRSFTVTLGSTTKTFVFMDDLSSKKDFSYTYSYEYIDSNRDTQTKNASGSVSVDVNPTATYSSGTIGISLQGLKNMPAVNSGEMAANWALGKLADQISNAFGYYDLGNPTGTDSSKNIGISQVKIYCDSITSGEMTLASGEFDFTVADNGNLVPTNYKDTGLAARVQNAANNSVIAAAAADYSSISGAAEGPSNIKVTGTTSDISTTNGSAGKATAGVSHVAEQYAYTDIDIDDLIGSTTDIEEMIQKFQFKYRDNELNATDTDPTDSNIFDSGNNLVVDKYFNFSGYYGSISYEFVDTSRDNTGKDYLYDEQKKTSSTVCDLNDLRNLYNTNGGNLKAAVAQFLYNSLNYTSYGRNRMYTRELLTSGSNPTVTNAMNADKIRLYAFQPYEGSNNSSSGGSTGSAYNNTRHYASGRARGAGNTGNNQQLVTGEAYLCSYDLDIKKWWEDNIGNTESDGDEETAKKLQDRLNQRGFRFYCGADNTASNQTEWVNIYFTDHSIEEDIDSERPLAGSNRSLGTNEKIDTIVVDVRNIKNYKELVRAIYNQANPASAGGAAANVGQVGFEGNPLSSANTDYFNHLLFAKDEDKGILTIFDTHRSSHGNPMLVSDGVYDNVRLEVREIFENRLIIHDTDHSSQAVAVHIPRTTMDYVFGFNPTKASLSDYTVLRKDMRERMLGMGKETKGILDRGLDYLTNANCLLGAQINRLEYSHANLVTSVENTESSESTLRDADMAKVMTQFATFNLLSQTAQSMLAQANQNSSMVLSLLQ